MESLAPKTPNLTHHMLKSDLWKLFKYKKTENSDFRGSESDISAKKKKIKKMKKPSGGICV